MRYIKNRAQVLLSLGAINPSSQVVKMNVKFNQMKSKQIMTAKLWKLKGKEALQ